MIELRCPECGGSITCIIERPDLYFYIDNGAVKRDKETDLITNNIVFICSYDSTHLVEKAISENPNWECEFLEKIKNILMEEK